TTTTPRWSTRTRGSGRRLRRWRAGGRRSGTRCFGGCAKRPPLRPTTNQPGARHAHPNRPRAGAHLPKPGVCRGAGRDADGGRRVWRRGVRGHRGRARVLRRGERCRDGRADWDALIRVANVTRELPMLKTQAHYDLMAQFEKEFKGVGRFDREPKESWPRQIIYQDGQVNELFLAYRRGYAFGKAEAIR